MSSTRATERLIDLELRWDRRALLSRGMAAAGSLVVGSSWLGSAAFGDARGFQDSEAPIRKARRPVHLHRLRLLSRRLDLQASFYRDLLGLPVEQRGSSQIVAAGSTEIELAPAAAGSAPMYHVAFNIPENKFDAALGWIGERVELLTNRRDGTRVFFFEERDCHSCYFFDPAGNLLELLAPHTLDNARPGPFVPEDILYACEIGIVVDDALETRAFLKQALTLDDFGPSFPSFCKVGDAHGMFIIVPKERLWLATDIPAAPFPCEITLAGAGPAVTLPGSPYQVHLQG